MADWSIERLDRSHDRTSFACGKPSLDEFLIRLVSQYEKRNLGRTYVAVQAGDKRVGGYYTLSSSAVAFQSMPKSAANKLPKHSVPALLLARLAVARAAQGQGLGELLLLDAFQRGLDLAERLGIHAVEVDCIDLQAKDFYEKYGFLPLRDDPLHLFLPIATIKRALDI